MVFVTQSIRRKLVFGLSVVLLMLVVASASGLYGLASYRNLVRDPVIDDRFPSSAADVAREIGRLQWAIHHDAAGLPVMVNPEELRTRIDTAQHVCAGYRRRLSELPQSVVYSEHQLAWQMIGHLEVGLDSLKQELSRRERGAGLEPHPVSGADAGANAIGADGGTSPLVIARRISQLERDSIELPDLPDELRHRLQQARRDYQSSLVLVSVCSGIVAVLLIGLVRFGFLHLIRPIQTLHQGARRVAQGDYSYRVTLPANDEMGELAEAFNLMTSRFEEVACSLDRQVQERSRQLVRSERLASVGLLAAGVAHEVNNPLSAVRWAGESLEMRLQELLRDAPEDEASVVHQYVRMIQTESERCQDITRRLLDFSRNHDAARTKQDVVPIIREVLTLITHMKKYRDSRIAFSRTEACLIELSGPEIKQVVLNLVANGLDAAGPSGSLRIELAEQIDWVEIRFADDGCGMTTEQLEHLFEPFFTTKPTGEGTGLGLSISNRIVCDHGGTIEGHSDGPGQGSTLVVRLPRSQGRIEAAETEAAMQLVQSIAGR